MTNKEIRALQRENADLRSKLQATAMELRQVREAKANLVVKLAQADELNKREGLVPRDKVREYVKQLKGDLREAQGQNVTLRKAYEDAERTIEKLRLQLRTSNAERRERNEWVQKDRADSFRKERAAEERGQALNVTRGRRGRVVVLDD